MTFLRRRTDPSKPLANNLGIVRLPGCEVERRAAGIESAVPPDDVRDGFGLDFAFRPLGVVVDVKVEQGVRVLVNQCPGEISVVLPTPYLDTRLHIDETQLLANALCLTVGPLVCWNDLHRHAEFIRGVGQLTNEVASVPSRLSVEVGERFALGLGDVKHRCGLEPDQALGPSSGGVSSYSQSLLLW